jgi:hypothetical protein
MPLPGNFRADSWINLPEANQWRFGILRKERFSEYHRFHLTLPASNLGQKWHRVANKHRAPVKQTLFCPEDAVASVGSADV